MYTKNPQDVEKLKALYRSLYQARLDLDNQSACIQGHVFSEGFEE